MDGATDKSLGGLTSSRTALGLIPNQWIYAKSINYRRSRNISSTTSCRLGETGSSGPLEGELAPRAIDCDIAEANRRLLL